ncbi:hypothetical protein Pmani_004678 [Petrolisthes manimaculis]|uniref:Alpha-1,3-mannosyl-glycoprotein 2-beta-N-acetylglucosaminyltransferase n=1 Tax=Petrolisthes manimaculis TaxID=1843537 RepID=A0AAE1UHC5_9EUCA|nr:hypothetical protein Pmani_004678 [Petrolisthes manimaculis]
MCVSGRLVSIGVSSGASGWGLEVKGCPSQSCATLPPPHHQDRQEEETQKGVTLSVLNQRDASLIFHKVFPLWQYWAHWWDLLWHLERLEAGRVVVLAVSVSGTIGLRHAIPTLIHLGALLVPHLPPRARWTWVFVKGGRTISETAVIEGSRTHQTHATTMLSNLPHPAHYPGSSRVLEEQRWKYCSSYGVMGGLCDELCPDLLPLPLPKSLNDAQTLALVPVIVTAGSRHQYLYHALTALLSAPGAIHSNVLVVLGDAPSSTTSLLSLLNISYVRLEVSGSSNMKLFHYYRDVFHLVATRFPEAPAVILLDEDIEVSPDFFSFMSQTLGVLQSDPTLYCINAHSAGGFRGLAHDETRVFRGSVQVEWGYAITLDFVREALSMWLNTTNPNTLYYDFWIYMNVRKQRECLFPEMTRSRHFGMGVNTNAYIKERGPLSMPMVRRAPVMLQDINRLHLSAWRQHLYLKIFAATPLQGNPCSSSFLPSPPSSSYYVFYYKLNRLKGGDGRPDPYQYYNVAECLGTWGMSEQGHHDGLKIIPFARNSTLLIVGVPYSHYSRLWPKQPKLWNVDALTDKEFRQIRNYTQMRVTVANEHVTSDVLMERLTGH